MGRWKSQNPSPFAISRAKNSNFFFGGSFQNQHKTRFLVLLFLHRTHKANHDNNDKSLFAIKACPISSSATTPPSLVPRCDTIFLLEAPPFICRCVDAKLPITSTPTNVNVLAVPCADYYSCLLPCIIIRGTRRQP